jgi:hypothetical protein
MPFTDMLAQMGGLQSMARELGVSDAQAASGAAALVPAILGGSRSRRSHSPRASTGSAASSGNSAAAACSTTCWRRP